MHSQHFKPTPPASLPAFALSSLNALAHGGASQTLFIPGENPDHFFILLDEAFAYHQPATSQDAALVTDSVQARWYLSRRQRSHAQCEFHLHSNAPDPTVWTTYDLNRLNLLDRYKTQAERALRRALTNVQAIRKDVLCEQHWQEHLALQKQHFQLQREKFEHTKAKDNRLSPKQQKQREIKDLLANAKTSTPPVLSCAEFGGSVIVQYIRIGIEKGRTFIDKIHPGNDEVRQIIRQRETYPEPPQDVARFFLFTHNIPPEYEFLIDEDFPRPEDDFCDTSYYFSFDEWHLLAEKEDQMPIKPQPADDEEESYQN